jgi:hypothetical protein
MQNKSVYITFVLLFLLSSCDKETAPDCFKQSGEETTITRYTNVFNNLILYSDIEVELVQSQETRIELIGGKNLLPKVMTNVEDKTLEIDNTNNCNFVRGYKRKLKLRVYCPNIRNIRNKGVGNISMPQGFVQDSLEANSESVGDIEVNGTFGELVVNTGSHGDVYIKGRANRFFAYIAGTNYLKAEGLRSKYVYTSTNGLGDCFVDLSETELFQYSITNTGNIYYSGVPMQAVNTGTGNAKGQLIKMN